MHRQCHLAPLRTGHLAGLRQQGVPAPRRRHTCAEHSSLRLQPPMCAPLAALLVLGQRAALASCQLRAAEACGRRWQVPHGPCSGSRGFQPPASSGVPACVPRTPSSSSKPGHPIHHGEEGLVRLYGSRARHALARCIGVVSSLFSCCHPRSVRFPTPPALALPREPLQGTPPEPHHALPTGYPARFALCRVSKLFSSHQCA